MQRRFDGTEIPLEETRHPPPQPIDKLCVNPVETRAQAEAGLVTPCYRCIAYRPETESGCHFLEHPHV